MKKYINKELILYGIVGVLTTIVNLTVYHICFNILHTKNVTGTIIAKFSSTLFAFIANKWYVFTSRDMEFKTVLKEFLSFFGFRFITLLLDVLIMYIAVDVFHFAPFLWKLISNILVIIINYVTSKLFVFRQ